MSRIKTVVAALAAVSLLTTASASAAIPSLTASAPARAGIHSFDLLSDGIFGCQITINAKNEGNSNVTIKLGESKSKNRGGLWNRWNNENNWVIQTGGNSQSNIVELSLPCSAGDRQYKFMMMKSGSEKEIQFPANDDFTGATSIALGNVARHF